MVRHSGWRPAVSLQNVPEKTGAEFKPVGRDTVADSLADMPGNRDIGLAQAFCCGKQRADRDHLVLLAMDQKDRRLLRRPGLDRVRIGKQSGIAEKDDMIPVGALFAAAQGLSAADIPVAWHISKDIGHGIAPDGLELGVDFLRRVLR